jgi:uncharacterized protein
MNTRPRLLWIALGLFLLIIFSRSICGLILDYQWWREMGQVATWIRMSEYRYLPTIGGWLILWILLWVAHARGMKYADTGLGEHPGYGRLVTLGLGLLALVLASASVDGWTVARYFGGSGVSSTWLDPAFGKPLGFYFFDLPFYQSLIGYLATCTLASALVYYVTARVWQVRERFPSLFASGQVDWEDLRALGKLETGLLTVLIALFLIGLAVSFWLGRYGLLYSDHGNLLVGINYVQDHISLPMQYLKAGAALLAAVLVLAGQRRLAIACAVVLIVDIFLPPLVGGLYVRPNELSLERPFLERHIEATRHAYGLDRRTREVPFEAHRDAPVDIPAHQPLLDNVRLWDWRPFHDTVTQTQPLRPYGYADSDVDRYNVDGRQRQVLLAPRELDLNQLGEARRSWINANVTFTHGYGLVLAEANRITSDGLPVLLVKDAPVQVLTKSLKITQPEIYYGESSHEPVFVRTNQVEFNYPSGSNDVGNRYDGRGGFPISSTLMRLVATLAQSDWNIVLSSVISGDSRMMIRRRVPERVAALADFIEWDNDPYIVITDEGHLVWMIDGYTTTSLHPYARSLSTNRANFNYIRNSIKATVDAYHGDVKMYVFDEEDPLIQAYRKLFPDLFSSASEMPADIRRHARAPEDLFRAQAEIYRTYHMRDPESYYNRADQWDLAMHTTGQAMRPEPVEPTFLVATLPGEKEAEFLLSIPFTPRNKQNLIGLMLARCDGEHLGEVVFLQLPKQEIIPGPLQIEALINQDQVISKDLSLWNTQGSQVLRSQVLTLPIDKTFLFVAPIFIQASEARMPQLRKVVLAVGNSLVYADTYQQALRDLAAMQKGLSQPSSDQGGSSTISSSTQAEDTSKQTRGEDSRIGEIRGHLERYRSLSSQGRWAEAGKELEAVESLVRKR